MESLLSEKLRVCDEAQTALLESGSKQIVEDMAHEFWGRGKSETGQNMLGKIWMKFRQKLLTNPNFFERTPKPQQHKQIWATREQQPRCYQCGETGHGMRQCRKQETVSCWECGLVGHKRKHCSYYSKERWTYRDTSAKQRENDKISIILPQLYELDVKDPCVDLTTEVVCNDATNYITEHYSVESDQNGQIYESDRNDQNDQSNQGDQGDQNDESYQNDNSEGLFSKVQNVRTKYANHIITFHLNINSLGSKIVEIKELQQRCNLDVLVLTKLDASFSQERLNIEGYNCMRHDQRSNSGGCYYT